MDDDRAASATDRPFVIYSDEGYKHEIVHGFRLVEVPLASSKPKLF
jgi:hypothetical protein